MIKDREEVLLKTKPQFAEQVEHVSCIFLTENHKFCQYIPIPIQKTVNNKFKFAENRRETSKDL